jgi:hypothetical protein
VPAFALSAALGRSSDPSAEKPAAAHIKSSLPNASVAESPRPDPAANSSAVSAASQVSKANLASTGRLVKESSKAQPVNPLSSDVQPKKLFECSCDPECFTELNKLKLPDQEKKVR